VPPSPADLAAAGVRFACRSVYHRRGAATATRAAARTSASGPALVWPCPGPPRRRTPAGARRH